MPLSTTPISIQLTVTPKINFAMQQNRIPVVQGIVITNSEDTDLERVQLRIVTEPAFTQPYLSSIERIPAGESIGLEEVALQIDAEMLASLTERMAGVIRVSLEKDGERLAGTEGAVDVLAYDEWPGIGVMPELLAAFVTPNHPEIARLCAKASGLLGKWSGDPSLDGYQSNNPDRIKQQLAAVYGALQECNFTYSVPPASFERTGQRIRLCDTMMQQYMGTCLDLALLYAGCLEFMGLSPMIVFTTGHAFVGVWLEDACFSEIVQDDVAALTKRIAEGIETIALVECTALTAGKNVSFIQAEAAAKARLSDAEQFVLLVDVHRARAGGIRPIPLRVMTPDGWVIPHEDRASAELTGVPGAVRQTAVTAGVVGAGADAGSGPVTRIMQWERKLLDLSLRNTLLNLRLTKSVIPILTDNLGALEDALAGGEDFQAMARPADWQDLPRDDALFELNTVMSGPHSELLRLEFRNKRLRTPLGETDLTNALVNLYRAAKVAQEENGANTLYLAMGLLKWYESPASQRPRYAPLVLLPIEMVRKSAQKGYVLRLRDDEPQMNITLLEMLKQDFGIDIRGLDPLPADAQGVDLRRVFSSMRQGIMQQARWDIVESAFLGIFSFTQFVMWNDIRNRSEDLARNKIVSSLIAGRLTWRPEAVGDDGAQGGGAGEAAGVAVGARAGVSLESGVMVPINADASQLRAIKAAGDGKSFVLHGPPGTGKSQTITNIIGNALAQGKSVLFVAEKMAALSVVQRRLQAIGIHPFCLEIHSNKSRKRDVLDQLKAATEVTRGGGARAYEVRAARLAAMREELRGYVEALHAERRCGLSLYEMISLYEDRADRSDARGGIGLPQETTAALDPEALEVWKERIGGLVAAGRDCGHPAGHPLGAVRRAAYSQELRMQAPVALAAWAETIDGAARSAAEVCARLEVPVPTSVSEGSLEKLHEACVALLELRGVPEGWLHEVDLLGLVRAVRVVAGHGRAKTQAYWLLRTRWDEGFLELDGEALLGEWTAASGKWFLPRAIGQGKLAKALKGHAKERVAAEALGEVLRTLVQYQREKRAVEEGLPACGGALAGVYRGVETDWAALEGLCDLAETSEKRLGLAYENSGELRQKCFGVAGAGDCDCAAQQGFVDAWTSLLAAQDAVYALLDIDEEKLEISGQDYLSGRRAACVLWSSNLNRLREWVQWRAARGRANVVGLGGVVAAYENGMAHEAVVPAFEKALYFSLILGVLQQEQVLNGFSGAVFEERIAQFKNLDKEFEDLTRQEIFARLAARVPDFTLEAAQSSELGILQRAIRNNGRGLSIRKMFDMIPNLLPRLCPCMLMSPISAAQYLDPKRAPFDLVVFDEASQMPTCKAVGVLARGVDAVIVGDPKQLPPTSFFASVNQDEENFETEDLESILDDCLALSMPNTHLLWHYRSRHESLIAFSNMQFYENRLLTFPSPNDQVSKVRLVEMGGYYDRGKTKQNRTEAQAIVDETVRRLEGVDTRGQSMGIVTFSVVQQNLIDDMLTEVFSRRPDLEELAYRGDEPLFVKNLENVQGDERDIILFSIGYGPDERGQVTLNFGPLNREGGWRRLNVAVSRARQEMLVYSTLRPEQIDVSRSSALGVAGLKAFLEYAKSGTQVRSADVLSQTKVEKGGIGLQICDALAAAGYTARRNVGRSGYRVDIGVVDPERPDMYLLGILLDGQNYRNAQTTRDREFAQIVVLNGLGWRIHRVWTMDWWDNQDKEIGRVLAAVEMAIAANAAMVSAAVGAAGAAGAAGVGGAANVAEPEADAANVTAEEEVCVFEKPKVDTVTGSASPGTGQTEVISKQQGSPPRIASSVSYIAELPKPEPARSSRYAPAVLPARLITPEEFMLPQSIQPALAQFQKVLQAEAPIAEELLVRRVLQSFGIARSGSRIQVRMAYVLKQLQAKTTRQGGGDVTIFWRNNQDPDQYAGFRIGARDAKHLPANEVANAVCTVLAAQFGLPREDLLRETAKLFEMSRMGSNVAAAMEMGVQYALEQGRVRIDGNGNVVAG